jgi:phage repressor protein C with HTH and peptisase S24 domain
VVESNKSDDKSETLDGQAEAVAFSERLRARAGEMRLTRAQLIERTGLKKQSFAGYWNGERVPPAHALLQLSEELDCSPRWLLIGEGQPAKHAAGDRRLSHTGADNDEDQVDIASIDFAYGFGGAYLDAGDPSVDKVRFSQAWLRARGITAPPELIGVAQGIGESMEPMFSDRDMIFFDRSARLEDHMGDKVWVFAYGQVGMVKILRPLPDGTIKIISANRMYPEEIALAEEIYIIGRVVSSWRTH